MDLNNKFQNMSSDSDSKSSSLNSKVEQESVSWTFFYCVNIFKTARICGLLWTFELMAILTELKKYELDD